MTEDLADFKDIRKKFEELDSEINTFFQSIKEIKEIRNTVAELPDRLKQNETEIENQQKELEQLMSSTNNLLITFEEKAKGLFFDLEKKTDNLLSDVKSSLSEFRNIFQINSAKLQDGQIEKLENFSEEYEHIRTAYETLKNIIDSNELTINTLKKDFESHYAETKKILYEYELSFEEIKKYISELQKWRFTIESKMNKREERLEALFDKKIKKQKKFIFVMLTIFIVSIIFFVLYFK